MYIGESIKVNKDIFIVVILVLSSCIHVSQLYIMHNILDKLTQGFDASTCMLYFAGVFYLSENKASKLRKNQKKKSTSSVVPSNG